MKAASRIPASTNVLVSTFSRFQMPRRGISVDGHIQQLSGPDFETDNPGTVIEAFVRTGTLVNASTSPSNCLYRQTRLSTARLRRS
jgi:hypothetical protein